MRFNSLPPPIPVLEASSISRTCAEVEADATEEVVGREAVVVPDGELETALTQVIEADVGEDERVVPLRVHVALHDRRLLLRAPRLLRQQIPGDHRYSLCDTPTFSVCHA